MQPATATASEPAPDKAPAPSEGSTPAASGRSKLWHNVAVRLADEGVPVRAISRALMMPTEDVREVLVGACERGMILSVPRDDWPPGTRRDERVPDTVPLEYEDDHMTMLAMRTFKLTPTMSKMLVAMLRRAEMTKAALHLCTQKDDGSNARPEPTDIKIVDVFICKLRAKLPAAIKIVTIWGRGYYITPEGKTEAYKLLGVKHDEFADDKS